MLSIVHKYVIISIKKFICTLIQFWYLVKWNQIWIVITLFWLIYHQTELYLLPNTWINGRSVIKIHVWFNVTRFRNINTSMIVFLWFLSNWKEYSNNYPFDYIPIGISFGLKSKSNILPLSKLSLRRCFFLNTQYMMNNNTAQSKMEYFKANIHFMTRETVFKVMLDVCKIYFCR